MYFKIQNTFALWSLVSYVAITKLTQVTLRQLSQHIASYLLLHAIIILLLLFVTGLGSNTRVFVFKYYF